MGLTDTGWSLGMIVSPIISGVIMDHLGITSIFVAGGILIIIGTGLIAVVLKGYGQNAPPPTGENGELD